MPYYVSLFLLNDPIPEPSSQVNRAVVEEEDDGSSVEGILQVMRSGVQYCDCDQGFYLCRSSEYSSWRGYSSWAVTLQASSP